MDAVNNSFNDDTVIVVDDETFSLSIVTQLCRSIGFKEVKSEKSAPDGLSALKTCASSNTPMIIADFRMPEHNGLELLKAVRMGMVHKDRALPVLMLTGHTDANLVSLAMKLDVDAFIAKPVSKAALEKRLIQIKASDRPVKDVAFYAKIPTHVASIEDEEDEGYIVEAPVGRVVELPDLKIGDRLAAPIKLSNSTTVLIEQGEELDQRLLSRLQDLYEMGSKMEEIKIY